MSEGKVTLIMLAVLTIALVFVGVSSKFNSLIVDVIVVLFLLISTVGATIIKERRLCKKNGR
ncbi:hypothetical protein [Bacillus cereus]|uniref:hypothetical protein n=1 Tax=Bacillus cereus TaxID=1396 RepID=UPI000BF4E267|nr:hypothetical protein [Bacillus cereus]PFM27587.1 hypothetical protein COJ43_31255 [Bacillus cereus]